MVIKPILDLFLNKKRAPDPFLLEQIYKLNDPDGLMSMSSFMDKNNLTKEEVKKLFKDENNFSWDLKINNFIAVLIYDEKLSLFQKEGGLYTSRLDKIPLKHITSLRDVL